MSLPCSLPQEIFDLIVDHLHGEPAVLKTCCVAAKSWVPRARKHLFASVTFGIPPSNFNQWQKTFPDPSNSPARYTRSLFIFGLPAVPNADTVVGPWIRTFTGLHTLSFSPSAWGCRAANLVLFHGLSPTLRSLRLSFSFDALDLICSFPLLEDLVLDRPRSRSDVGRWNPPLTSPKFTGSLNLRGTCSFTRQLLDLPGGLHFTKITISCSDQDLESMADLVSGCSGTLESLDVRYSLLAMTTHWRSLDLSKATKLKDLALRWRGPSPQRITMALQTIESKKLQHITIHLYNTTLEDPVEEMDHREWQDLDHLLVQLWTSHSIRPQAAYEVVGGGKDLRDHAPSLLPELTRRGLVDLVEVKLPLDLLF